MANPVDTEITYPEVDNVELPTETPIVFDEGALDEDESLLENPVMLTEEQVSLYRIKPLILMKKRQCLQFSQLLLTLWKIHKFQLCLLVLPLVMRIVITL